ncbi:GNAT family N-acetyltransferase [Halomarina ordinaria]|uniref:GNAT family N-acetyltransferase n=1 Tax=Halomarina ordinaria TaxID=3033939 RepID=A0ABD5U9A6_9EURY|nr:GNAT family N-acetyltransferase [Halomarina sp. PSRA2]
MTEVTVRPAAAADVDGIRRVAQLGWEAAYGAFLDAETVERAMREWYDPDVVAEGIEDPSVVYRVAASDGVVGYATGRLDRATGHLTSLYVDPGRWGEGVGSRLFEAVLERLAERGAEYVEIRVLAENEVGRSFYAGRGVRLVIESETDLFGERVREVVYAGPVRSALAKA